MIDRYKWSFEYLGVKGRPQDYPAHFQEIIRALAEIKLHAFKLGITDATIHRINCVKEWIYYLSDEQKSYLNEIIINNKIDFERIEELYLDREAEIREIINVIQTSSNRDEILKARLRLYNLPKLVI